MKHISKTINDLYAIFNFDVADALEYCRRRGNYSAHRLILWTLKNTYYKYEFFHDNHQFYVKFQEISHDEYTREIKKYDESPLIDDSKDTEISKRQIHFKEELRFKLRYVELSECSPYYKVINDVITNFEKQTREKNEKKKQYARECRTLADATGFSFTNVLVFQQDLDQLADFYESMEKAIELYKKFSPQQRISMYHDLFESNRSQKQNILFKLGIKFGKTNPEKLDLTVLKKRMENAK